MHTDTNTTTNTGFPVGPHAPSCFDHCTSFNTLRDRRRVSVYGQAGNSMCVPIMGLLILFVCAHVDPRDIDRATTPVCNSKEADDTASAFAKALLASRKRAR